MSLKELMDKVKTKVGDKPFKQLSLPKMLSRRPIFVG